MTHPVVAVHDHVEAAFTGPTLRYRAFPTLGPEPDGRGVAVVAIRQGYTYTDTLSRGPAPASETISVALQAAVAVADLDAALTELEAAYIRFAEAVAEAADLTYRVAEIEEVRTQYLSGEDQVALVDTTWTMRED